MRLLPVKVANVSENVSENFKAGVNFASVHGLTPVTVHMSFSLPRGNFERRVTRCPTPGNRLAEVTFLDVNRTQKLPRGKSSLSHAHF